MDLIQESFQRLFPEKKFFYQTRLEYNRRLAAFNANIRLQRASYLQPELISVHLNLKWREIDKEIIIGLIQNLLLKVLKEKAHTPNIDLYTNFIKNIPLFAEKTRNDPFLEASFNRVNQLFFSGSLEKPNLQWGTDSRRKLAHYNFHDDSVTVSTLFQPAPTQILDYLMYHELLHKYHQFEHKNGRGLFHSPAFKADEQKFPKIKEIEREIHGIVRKRRFLGLFS